MEITESISNALFYFIVYHRTDALKRFNDIVAITALIDFLAVITIMRCPDPNFLEPDPDPKSLNEIQIQIYSKFEYISSLL